MVTDIELGTHCPKHGAGANEVRVFEYPNGDADYLCHCGNLLAEKRDGKMYMREVA